MCASNAARSRLPPVLSFGDRTLTHGKEMVISRLGGARLSGPLQKYRAGVPVMTGAVLLLPDGAGAAAGRRHRRGRDRPQPRHRAGACPPVGAPARPLSIQHIAGVPARAAIALDKDSYAAVAALPDGAVLHVDADAKPPVVAHTWNAMGRLTGRSAANAGDVILLTAHLDHLGNRAPANRAPRRNRHDLQRRGRRRVGIGGGAGAGGSAGAREAAEAHDHLRVVRQRGGPAAPGASHFIDAPPVPLEQIVANLEFEMIGRADKAVPAAHAVAHRIRAQQPGSGARETGSEDRRGSASGAELLHAFRQHPARAPRRHRADRLELRPAHRLSPAVRRSEDDRLRAHDRVDPVDACAGALAGELEIQAGVAAGEEAVARTSRTGRARLLIDETRGGRARAPEHAGVGPAGAREADRITKIRPTLDRPGIGT